MNMSERPELVVIPLGALARHLLWQPNKAYISYVDRTFNKLGKGSKNLQLVYYQIFSIVKRYLMAFLVFYFGLGNQGTRHGVKIFSSSCMKKISCSKIPIGDAIKHGSNW
jgi:hypothetical protein